MARGDAEGAGEGEVLNNLPASQISLKSLKSAPSAPPRETLRRRWDWPEKLAAVLKAARSRPFEWGAHDCVLFCAAATEAMCGIDPAAALRGVYKSAAGEVRAAKRLFGVSTLADLAAALWGEESPPARARRGDVVLVEAPEGEALGVAAGAPGIAVVTRAGLAFAPARSARRAWRCG